MIALRFGCDGICEKSVQIHPAVAYVKQQVRRIHELITDLPLGTRDRFRRGVFIDILSIVTYDGHSAEHREMCI